MPDELHYTTHLLDWDDALNRLADYPLLRQIVFIARELFYRTSEIQAQLEEEDRRRAQTTVAGSEGASTLT